MSLTFLVYGWFNKQNVGDELMKQALRVIFEPKSVDLRFVDHISTQQLVGVDAVVFGGGSILYDDPVIDAGVLAALLAREVPTFYVGVGGETAVGRVHQQLLDVAELTFFRELDVPDLVYALEPDLSTLAHPPKGVLFVPNVEVVPTHAEPHWAHVAWEHFKNEVAQCLDQFIDRGVPVSFLLMCNGEQKQDAWPAAELMGRMLRRAPRLWTYAATDLSITRLMRHFECVVTQRYHGIILSELAGVPYVSIAHHDKLKLAQPHRGQHLAYHAMNKDMLTDALELARTTPIAPHRVPRKVYDDMVDQIISVVTGGRKSGHT